jgi:hypothetical protein
LLRSSRRQRYITVFVGWRCHQKNWKNIVG